MPVCVGAVITVATVDVEPGCAVLVVVVVEELEPDPDLMIWLELSTQSCSYPSVLTRLVQRLVSQSAALTSQGLSVTTSLTVILNRVGNMLQLNAAADMLVSSLLISGRQ